MNGTEIISGSTGLPVGTITSLPPWMNSLAVGVMEVEGRPALPLTMMPSETQRASIASRIEALERELTSADRRDVAQVVGKLFLAFPSSSVSVEVQKAKIALYVEDLGGLPLWALEKAAGKWRRGEAKGDAKFAPSAAELRRIAEEQTLQHRQQIIRLNRILTAKPLSRIEHSAEAKERVAAKAADFLKAFAEQEGSPT